MFPIQCLRCGLGNGSRPQLKSASFLSSLWGLMLLCQIPIALFVLIGSHWHGFGSAISGNPLISAMAATGVLGLLMLRGLNFASRFITSLILDGLLAALILYGCFASGAAALTFGEQFAAPKLQAAVNSTEAIQRAWVMWESVNPTMRSLTLIACGSLGSAFLLLLPKLTLRLFLGCLLALLATGTTILGTSVGMQLQHSPVMIVALGMLGIALLRGFFRPAGKATTSA